MAGKETGKEVQLQERKEPSAKEFTAPGELETGYTEKSWAKPEKSMEETTTAKTEEVKSETIEHTTEMKGSGTIEREDQRKRK